MTTPEVSTFADGRERTDITPASAYKASQPVWVNRHGWRPGVALFGSDQAVSVRYCYSGGPGTTVDTVLPIDLAPRTKPDPYLDRGGAELVAPSDGEVRAACDG
jgi:hypothetical protein